MEQSEQNRELCGRVEIDDAYLGGERRGKPGHGSPNKIPFIAAVQTNDDGHPQLVRFDRVKGFTHDEIELWSQRALSAATVAHYDGLSGFTILSEMVNKHLPTITGSGPSAVQHAQFKWVNTLLANLKTSIAGTYHAIKFQKYTQSYLSEAQYRFNRRFDLRSILPKLLHAAATTKPKPLRITRLTELCT